MCLPADDDMTRPVLLTNSCGKYKERDKNRTQKEISEKSFENERDKLPLLVTPKYLEVLERVINKQV